MATVPILKSVSGVIAPASTTAVMGASGAGKTTLLNVLAGFAGGPRAVVNGSIAVNGVPVTAEKMRQISGFVQQEDVLLHTMTVREVLQFSAMLKLPPSMPTKAKHQRALEVAHELNLTKALDSVVGSAMIRGISGGEKRRLSVGCELITNPFILYLDEPTSGLDLYTAYKVCRILKSMVARHHCTVICTIHQPSSDIFHMFDNLIVLAEGQVVYGGPTASMVDWFGALGFPCPRYTNPADFLFMAVLTTTTPAAAAAAAAMPGGGSSGYPISHHSGPGSVGAAGGADDGDWSGYPRDALLEPAMSTAMSVLTATSSGGIGAGAGGGGGGVGSGKPAPAAHRASHTAAASSSKAGGDAEHLDALIAAWAARTQQADMQHGLLRMRRCALQRPSLQFLLLCKRAARNALRNPLIAKAKLAQTIFFSLVVGLIYLRLGYDLSAVQGRQGHLFMFVLQGILGGTMGVLLVFEAEKPVFRREYGSRMYGVPAYFMSRWVVELPNYIINPVLASLIVYWLIGYQDQPDKFSWFALIAVLMDVCGASLGFLFACVFKEVSVALSLIPMIMLPLMVFSGYFVNSAAIPQYYNWIQYISPIRYGYVALIKNEFAGLKIECQPENACAADYDGNKVIELMGFAGAGSVAQNAGVLFSMVLAILLLAYVALWNGVRGTAHKH